MLQVEIEDRVYISGPMTGDPDYKKKFEAAERYVTEELHAAAVNPAKVVESIKDVMSYEELMDIDLKLLSMCTAIALLPGWQKSLGANREYGFAVANQLDKHHLAEFQLKKYMKPEKTDGESGAEAVRKAEDMIRKDYESAEEDPDPDETAQKEESKAGPAEKKTEAKKDGQERKKAGVKINLDDAKMSRMRIEGASLAQIAKEFDVSPQTVSNHLAAYQKKHPNEAYKYAQQSKFGNL